jgi:hypothetical protein
MAEQEIVEFEKKSVENTGDLLDIYSRQIRNMAYELQFGNLVVEFKVRNGEVKEAHKISDAIKLRPF